jgi:hypothetical protein
MFSNFIAKFKCEQRNGEGSASPFSFGNEVLGLEQFFEDFSGCSFNQGLYRIHSSINLEKWNKIVGDAFPDFRKRIFCFGYDWLGRHFALDNERIEQGEPLILMLEPGTGEVLEIPVNFLSFHNEELVLYTNEALAEDFFISWLQIGNPSPKHNECIGYKRPLFLGGTDTVDNLEVADMEVYWSISGQLISKVKKLSPGTNIDDIFIS